MEQQLLCHDNIFERLVIPSSQRPSLKVAVPQWFLPSNKEIIVSVDVFV